METNKSYCTQHFLAELVGAAEYADECPDMTQNNLMMISQFNSHVPGWVKNFFLLQAILGYVHKAEVSINSALWRTKLYEQYTNA